MKLLKLAPALACFIADTDSVAVQAAHNCCLDQARGANRCQRCVDTCPSEAITATKGQVVVDKATCVRCGFCLHACPTGAFTGTDETTRLLDAAADLPPGAVVDLACSHFPVEYADRRVDTILQLGNCLAALGEAAYVGLAAQGVTRVGVRLEGCFDCPIGALRVQIEDTLARVEVLAKLDVAAVDMPAPDETRKPVVKTPAVQRRRKLLEGGEGALPVPDSSAGKGLPRERRALLDGLAHLPVARQGNGPFFPRLTAAPTCTACGECAIICPTGALTWTEAGDSLTLEFAPLACTGCGLCIETCAPGALRTAAPVSYAGAAAYPLLHRGLPRCSTAEARTVGSLQEQEDYRV